MPYMDTVPVVIMACVLVITVQILIRVFFPQQKLKDICLKEEEQKKIDINLIKYFAATILFLIFLLIRVSFIPGYN